MKNGIINVIAKDIPLFTKLVINNGFEVCCCLIKEVTFLKAAVYQKFSIYCKGLAMPQHDTKREQLIKFLDKNAFDPILNLSEDKFSSVAEKAKFRDVKRNTQSEKNRFHNNYPTAQDVKQNYLSDLHSRTADKKNSELKELGLPRLPELREQFLDLCNKLDL